MVSAVAQLKRSLRLLVSARGALVAQPVALFACLPASLGRKGNAALL